MPSIFQNAEQESRSCMYASMIRCHQFNKHKTKKQNKRKKPKTNLLMHLDEEIIFPSIPRLCLHLYIQQ